MTIIEIAQKAAKVAIRYYTIEERRLNTVSKQRRFNITAIRSNIFFNESIIVVPISEIDFLTHKEYNSRVVLDRETLAPIEVIK